MNLDEKISKEESMLNDLLSEKTKCVKCGSTMKSTSNIKYKFCSCSCNNKYTGGFTPFQTIYCHWCGNRFVTKSHKSFYCSKECKDNCEKRAKKIENVIKNIDILCKKNKESISSIELKMRKEGKRYADFQKAETIKLMKRRSICD